MAFVRNFKPVLCGMLAASVAGGALAQQPQRPPARPAQQQAQQPPAAPAQPQGPTIVQLKGEPSQPDWLKVCGKDGGAEICYVTRDFVSDQGQPVLAIAVYDVKGQQPQQNTRIVRVLLPLMLMLRPGVRVGVDSGQPTPGQFAICMPNGCFAEVPGVNDAFMNGLKRGTVLNISVQNQVGNEVTFAAPLSGFAKAFDGPPVDPAKLEEARKQAEEQLRQRAEQMRQQQGGAPAPAAPAPAAPAPKQ
ncbi:MAG: invasion-associated locus B family protein [Rhizobiales bacterium 65-9]|nr:MAG: invasion-associated locus B family protein [Rhizobiales bacterium 65-9]